MGPVCLPRTLPHTRLQSSRLFILVSATQRHSGFIFHILCSECSSVPYSADIYKVPTRSQELELHSDTAGDGGSQERELEAKWTEGARWASIRRLAPVLLLRAPSILGSETENQHMPLASCCRFCSEPLPVTRSPVSRLRERELFCISFDKQGCWPCSCKRVFRGACVLQLAPDLDILFLWAGQFHKHRFVQRRQPIKNICRVNKNQGR